VLESLLPQLKKAGDVAKITVDLSAERVAASRQRNPFARKLAMLVDDHLVKMEVEAVKPNEDSLGQTVLGIDGGLYQPVVRCDEEQNLFAVELRCLKRSR
jgi:hypothetical protein